MVWRKNNPFDVSLIKDPSIRVTCDKCYRIEIICLIKIWLFTEPRNPFRTFKHNFAWNLKNGVDDTDFKLLT
jgi:hypothetical protein